ncbi:hypothetical protein BTVI_120417 [Pitangus sulphuratus]|nr:hypothetical protein BTVI_120417 [Pitangus sulphuratus]
MTWCEEERKRNEKPFANEVKTENVFWQLDRPMNHPLLTRPWVQVVFCSQCHALFYLESTLFGSSSNSSSSLQLDQWVTTDRSGPKTKEEEAGDQMKTSESTMSPKITGQPWSSFTSGLMCIGISPSPLGREHCQRRTEKGNVS